MNKAYPDAQSKPRLLIVDDLPENTQLLSDTLKREYSTQVANSGQHALDLASQEPPPDLILLDVLMPGMDGYEVCQALKRIPSCADIPVIFVTALHDFGDEERGLALGAVDFITKPFHPALVKARVKNHLELKRQRDHLEREVWRRSEELTQARLAQQIMENDLQLALKLQLSMLPQSGFSIPGGGGGEIATHLRPARAIGGDLYDYIRLGSDRLLFALGDASGKGVTAALFMVRVFTLLRWLVPASSDPSRLLSDLNEALHQDNEASMFVTMACGILDLASGDVLYSSGGHEAAILLSTDREADVLEVLGGPALGLFGKADFPLHKLHLEPGQSLMLFSDGVVEANNLAHEEFGLTRLLESLNSSCDTRPQAVIERCLAALDSFTAGAETFDDSTILVVRPFSLPG